MKKTLMVITLLAGAVSGYSQGEIVFEMYNAASGAMKQAIYGLQAVNTYAVTYNGSTVYETVGSVATGAESPKGTTTYTGTGLSGTAFDVQLMAGPANSSSAASLIAVGTPANFKTSASLLGFMSGSEAVTLPTNSWSGTAAAPTAVTLAVAAWNNEGGTITSLAAAVAADTANPNSVPWGISPLVQSSVLAENPSPSSAMPDTSFSFSLGTMVPEPSTIALGVMGASALFVPPPEIRHALIVNLTEPPSGAALFFVLDLIIVQLILFLHGWKYRMENQEI